MDTDKSPIEISFEKYGLAYTETLSKKTAKKLAKKEYLEARKKENRAKVKEKKKQLKKELLESDHDKSAPVKRLTLMADSECKQRIAIDLSFIDGHHMKFFDMNKCKHQVQYCYSVNRKIKNPLQLYLTSVSGLCKQVMSLLPGYENWDVNFSTDSYLSTFKKEEIVYLTSDSENVLSSLDDAKVYIIGGLVDHNLHKGLCHELAESNEVAHARLPIEKYIDMKTRKVLAINHVFEIITQVSSGVSWQEALLKIIPMRKAPKVKNKSQKVEKEIKAENIQDENS